MTPLTGFSLATRLRAGETVYTAWCSLASPPIVADAPDPSLWRCVVSDVALDVACPLVLLSESGWIQRVAELAWQGALEVDA